MADERIFTLTGKFDDKITPSLRKLETSLNGLSRSFDKMKRNLRPIAKDMAIMAEGANRISEGFKNQRGSIDNAVRGLSEYRREMGKAAAAQEKLQKRVSLPTFNGGDGSSPSRSRRSGGRGDGSGSEGKSLSGAAAVGTFLGGGALMAASGAATMIGNSVQSAFGFLGDRFKEAMEDEINDIQAQGAIFGVLRKEGITSDYKTGKKIAKTLDIEIAKMVASSPIPTETITTLNRTLSDTFLPSLMKGFQAEGETTFEAARSSAKQLAGFYEQIGYLTPPGYPIGMVTKGITKLVEAGKITGELSQIDFFQMNPQLIPTLKQMNFEGQKTIMDRMKVLQKAMSVVMPPEAMAEIRTSLTAGMQGLQDNLTNVSVGLLSFGAEFKNEQKKVVSYVYRDLVSGKMVEGFREVSTPFQMISAKLAPVLLELGALVGAVVNKLGPVTEFLSDAFDKFLGPALMGLTKGFSEITDAVTSGDLKDLGSVIGKVVGNVLKALTTGLDSISKADGPMGEFMKNFADGLNSVFPPESQAKLTKTLENAFSTLLSKTVEFAAPPLAALLVTTVKGFISGLFNAGLVGKLLLGGGALKLLGGGSMRKGFGRMMPSATGFGRSSMGLQGPMPTAGAQRGMEMGANIRNSFRGTLAGKAGSRMQQFAQNRMPGVVGMGGQMMGRVGGGMRSLGAKMGGVGGAATALTAVTGIIDTVSTLSEYDSQIKTVNENIKAAAESGDTQGVAGLLQQKAELQKQKGAAGAAGTGGVVGAVAGGALGAAIAGPIGAMIGSQLGSTIGTAIGPAIGNWWNGTAWPALQSAWTSITSAFSSGFAFVQSVISGIGAKVGEAKAAISTAFASLPGAIQSGLSFVFKLLNPLSGISTIISLVRSAVGVLGNLKWPSWLPGGGGGGNDKKKGANGIPRWNGKNNTAMPLNQAIASEMRNKPPGSDLVIANSSETIIPAADGLNTGGLNAVVNATYSAAQSTASVFTAGFQSFSQKLFAGQQAMVTAINKGTQASAAQNATMLAKLSAQNAALMSKMTAVAAAAGNAGGGAGGAIALGGGYGSRGSQIAGALGTYIKQTGGAPGSIHEHPQHGGVKYKHSPNSYHYKGRAIDIGAYANEQGGVLRRIAAFNAKMGVKPVELLKAGDPGHSDHVHVAYALGAGNPAFFNSANAADSWEAMMAKGSPIISSVRARANEMQGGGAMTVNAPITINQQPGQDSDELAAIVAMKLTQAVNNLRYASYKV